MILSVHTAARAGLLIDLLLFQYLPQTRGFLGKGKKKKTDTNKTQIYCKNRKCKRDTSATNKNHRNHKVLKRYLTSPAPHRQIHKQKILNEVSIIQRQDTVITVLATKEFTEKARKQHHSSLLFLALCIGNCI